MVTAVVTESVPSALKLLKERCLARGPLTQSRLKELLHYSPTTGEFIWLKQRGPGAIPGQFAGCLDDEGYTIIRVDIRIYKAHRLAFLYMTGKWPERQVDHINRLKSDNRWENLRDVTPLGNALNRRTPSNNRSGFVGVVWHSRHLRWMGRFSGRHLGYFDSAEQASRAYQAAKDAAVAAQEGVCK